MQWGILNIRLGTDLVHIPRIQAAIERFGQRFVQRVYTPAEQQDCWGGKVYLFPQGEYQLKASVIQRLAARWAGKEAVTKALGTGWRGISYTEIEILRQSTGEPQVYLSGAAANKAAEWGDGQWQISLSHDGEYAIATAILFSV